MPVWLIRCGDRGKEEHKERFFTENLVAIGYGLKRPVTDFDTFQELKNSPDMRARAAASGRSSSSVAGKLWHFAGRGNKSDDHLRTGDLVLTPYTTDAKEKMLAIGEVVGDYDYKPSGVEGHQNPHIRPVSWKRDIPAANPPSPLRKFLQRGRTSGFERIHQVDEVELRQFLDNRNAPA